MAPVPLPWRRPESVCSVREPRDAVCAKRLVEEAVVANDAVEVAFARVVAPVTLSEFSHEVPETVKLVVEAPPFSDKRPVVKVEEALEMKPLVNVARPVWVRVPV